MRENKILHAVVTDYIQTAEPSAHVPFRAITKLISAATIRNEMADLEELGY